MDYLNPIFAQLLEPFAPPPRRAGEDDWRAVEMAEAQDPRLLRALRDQQQQLKEYEG